MKDTIRSVLSRVSTKLDTVNLMIVLSTGETLLGTMLETTAGPSSIVTVWVVSENPLIVMLRVEFLRPEVNCSGMHTIWVDDKESISQGVPSSNVIEI